MLEKLLRVSHQEAAGCGTRPQPRGGLCSQLQQLVLGYAEKGLGQGEGQVVNRPCSAVEHVYDNISSELRLIYWTCLKRAQCPVRLGGCVPDTWTKLDPAAEIPSSLLILW